MKKSMSLLLLLIIGVLPQKVQAFSCKMNGVVVPIDSEVTIPVDIILHKDSEEIMLFNLSPSFVCTGVVNSLYQDALRITPESASLHSSLADLGYIGFITDSGGNKYDFSAINNNCIWPDNMCTVGGANTRVLSLKVGIKKKTAGRASVNSVTVPPGATIAKFKVQQRGAYGRVYWGHHYYNFNFVLKFPVIIPTYTCNVTNADQTVTLDSVKASSLREKGVGKSTEGKLFSFNLACDPKTIVDVSFEGTAMDGYNDVLKNTYSQTDAVGIQVLYNDTPVVLGQTIRTVDNANANEIINFKAHYFYNGSLLQSGPVRSIATVTFDYK